MSGMNKNNDNNNDNNKNDNGRVEVGRVEVGRVEIDMRPVKDAHLPIGVMITKDGLLKQPTKKESEQLKVQKKNTTVKKSNSENLLKQIEQVQVQAKQPIPSTGGKKKKRTRKMKKRKTLKKRYHHKNKYKLTKKRYGNNKKPRYTTKRRR
jgi:hypothetical protein